MLHTALVLVGLMALSSQAFAGGPIYTYRYELPPAIARLHTCICPRQRTLRYPDPWRVGKRRMFRVGCPENAPDITRLPHRNESGYVRKPDDDPDHFQSTVYYLADNARGRNAKRLALPYPRADENCSGPFCSAKLTGYSLIKSDKPTGIEARALS